jgi:hypothetical protein
VDGMTLVSLGFKVGKACTKRRVVKEIDVPRHNLSIPGSPGGTRRRARDMRANHDTFHDRKSVHELNCEGIKDETRKEKHSSDLGVENRGSSRAGHC